MPRKRRTAADTEDKTPAPEAVDAATDEVVPEPEPPAPEPEVADPVSPARFPCSVHKDGELYRLIGADGSLMVDDAGRIRDGGGYADQQKAERRSAAINGEPAKRERAQRDGIAA